MTTYDEDGEIIDITEEPDADDGLDTVLKSTDLANDD
jgi:hypothetical protein